LNYNRSFGVSPAYYVTVALAFVLLAGVVIAILLGMRAFFSFMDQLLVFFGPDGEDPTQMLVLRALNLLLIVPCAWLLLAIIAGKNASYEVTPREINIRYATLKRTSQRLLMTQVQDVAVRQTLWGRMVGYGDVLVQTAGSTAALPIRYVAKPEQVADSIHALAKASAASHTPSQWEF